MKSITAQAFQFRQIQNWLILLVAAINGLIYLLLVPPWQNNDEMGQFEYAWLIASLGHLPTRDQYDQSIRREILSSMVEYDFFRHVQMQPNLIEMDKPVWIGPEQVGGFPLYYILLAIPLRLMKYLDVTLQLYFSRLISWSFFVGTILIIKKAIEEIFTDEQIRLNILTFGALLPGFVSKMVAVNDDVAAVFWMTLWIWLSFRILVKGVNVANGLGFIVSMVFGLFTKQTTWTLIPFGVYVIIFGIFGLKRERLLIGIWVAVSVVLVSFFIVSWRKSYPAYFYLVNGSIHPLRSRNAQAVSGKYVLEIESTPSNFYQVIDLSSFKTSDPLEVSLGFWAWSTNEVSVSYPLIIVDGEVYQNSEYIELSKTPMFFRTAIRIDKSDIQKGVVKFSFDSSQKNAKIYVDCVLLVPGDQTMSFPNESDEECSHVRWGSYHGKNILRNGSFEKGWIALNEFALPGPISINHIQLYNSLFGLIDQVASGDYIRDFSRYLFMTFWGRFGWGTVPYYGDESYCFFIGLTLIACIGLLFSSLSLWRVNFWGERKGYLILFLMGLIFAQLFIVYLREAGNWDVGYLLLPQARYFFPVILPISIFFGAGWYNFQKLAFSRMNKVYFGYIELLMMLVIDFWSITSIWLYYYS